MKTFINGLIGLAVFFACTGCGPTDVAESTHAGLDKTLSCGENEVGWNFSEFPVSASSSEGVSKSPNADVKAGDPPGKISVLEAQCVNGPYFTGALQENCGDRLSCITKVVCAPNSAFTVKFQCIDDVANRIYNLISTPSFPLNVGPSGERTFQFSCPQPTPKATATVADKRCVPQQCHGATRRDKDLKCVADFNRQTVELHKTLSNGGFAAMAVEIGYDPFKLVYTPRRLYQGTNFDTTINPSAPYSTQLDQYLAENWMLFPKGVYDLTKTRLYYYPPINPSTEARPLKGRVVLWLADEWAEIGTSKTISSFRCVMHSIELQKYNIMPGTEPAYADLNQERFLLPTNCTAESNAFEYLQLEAKKLGLTDLLALQRKYTFRGTKLKAAFDLEGVNIVVPKGMTRESACAPNPVDFFYDTRGNTHDLGQYYAQNAVPVYLNGSTDRSLKFGPVNRTELGLSAVRPRQAEVRLKTFGPTRGGIRVDYDWYLANDRNTYWSSFGFSNFNSKLVARTYLVPKDSNGNQIAAGTDGYTLLGETQLFKTDGLGETQSFRYPVTDTLKNSFMRKGSPIEIGETGRRTFEVLTCLEILNKETLTKRGGNGLSTGNEPTSYWLELATSAYKPPGFGDAGPGCRWGATPLQIRLDRAVEPVEPLSPGDWAGEANPAEAGDGRMAQKLDNDGERNCDTNTTGDTRCNSTASNGVGGTGAFGGTYVGIDAQGEIDTSQPYAGQGEGELMGFAVMDEEEEQPWSGPKVTVKMTVAPPWEDIRAALSKTYTAPEWKTGRYAGMMGLGVGWGFKFPVFVGPVQIGVAVVSVSLGISLELSLEWSAESAYPCIDKGAACGAVMPSANFRKAMIDCYASGGRLGEMSTLTESQKVKGTRDADGSDAIWLGAQIANEYVKPECRTAWNTSQCGTGHITLARWLTNDEDFGKATSFGAMSLLDAEIKFPGATPPSPSTPAGQPIDRGVVLNSNGSLELRNMNDSFKSICVYDDAKSDQSHTFKAAVGIGIAAGIGLAFCTPSDEAGICLVGSVNLVSVGLTPSFSYVYHRLKNAAGKTSVQSNVNFSFDWELKVLEGSIDVKLVFGPFELSYNLFTFDGLKLPKSVAGGKFVDLNFPSIEAFK